MKLKTLTPAEAQGYADAFAKFNPSLAGLKRFDDVAGCTYATLPDVAAWFVYASEEKRKAAMRKEAVSGWFQSDEDEDDTADEDGDFVSTPCYDPSNTLGEIIDFLDDCSRSDLLLVDPRFFS
jgi:hypothetical protein